MTALPPGAVEAAKAAIPCNCGSPDPELDHEGWCDMAIPVAVITLALEAAAPAIREPAVRLVEEALHLAVNGERAPGGDETWAGWERKAEEYLRGLTP